MEVCYKPVMRKWMSERLRRRKKAPDETKGEAKPAPLQPAYFNKDTAVPEASTPKHQASTSNPAGDTSDSQPPAGHPGPLDEAGQETSRDDSLPAPQSPAFSSSHAPDPRRRRRGRGGRGRGRSGQGRSPETASGNLEASGPKSASPSETAPAPPASAGGPLPASAVRPLKGAVVLAIGLPGSGKSSWFKRHNINSLSSDLLRALLFDDPAEQRFQDLVFSNLRSMLKARLIARRPLNYVDATNLTPHERQGWIKLAKDYGYEVQAVFFDVPLEVCLERNQKRQRVVTEEVMRRMSAKLKAPTFEEGFSKITVVRVKQKENEPQS